MEKIIHPMKKLSLIVVGLVVACLGLAAAELSDVSFVLGPKKLKDGDMIVVEQVRATSPKLEGGDTVVVRGRYELKSEERAIIGLSLTQTVGNGSEQVVPAQWTEIKKGSGEFELSYQVKHIGALHLTFSTVPEKKSFGTVYFGTPQQLDRIRNMSLADFDK
ncbi:MAG: hypothetical protein QM790_05870 [Nibricoccus sp.]